MPKLRFYGKRGAGWRGRRSGSPEEVIEGESALEAKGGGRASQEEWSRS